MEEAKKNPLVEAFKARARPGPTPADKQSAIARVAKAILAHAAPAGKPLSPAAKAVLRGC